MGDRTFAKGDGGQNVCEGMFTKGDGGQNVRKGMFAKGDRYGVPFVSNLLFKRTFTNTPMFNITFMVVNTNPLLAIYMRYLANIDSRCTDAIFSKH